MPLPFAIAAAALCAIPFLILGIAGYFGAKKARRVNEAWAAFAASQGWRFSPGKGALFWKSPELEALRSGVTVRFRTYPGTMPPKRPMTATFIPNPTRGGPIVIATTTTPSMGSVYLEVVPRGAERAPTMPTGDPAFDARLSVSTRQPDLARRLVNPTFRGAMVKLADRDPEGLFFVIQPLGSRASLELQLPGFGSPDQSFVDALAALSGARSAL